MNVRRAVIGDEALLRRFRLEALTIEPDAFGSTYDRELARIVEDWQRWISSGVVFILEEAEGARGMVAAAHEPADHAIVQLTTMWVQPDARGYGGAHALMAAVVAWAQSERASAVHTDELDCVVMLRFPQEFVGRFGLRVDARLLTVNTYLKQPSVAPDLIPGPGAFDDWQNVNPLIADFMSEDSDRIAEHKAEIDESEWELCALLGREYLRLRPGVARDGSPYECARPAPTGNADSHG